MRRVAVAALLGIFLGLLLGLLVQTMQPVEPVPVTVDQPIGEEAPGVYDVGPWPFPPTVSQLTAFAGGYTFTLADTGLLTSSTGGLGLELDGPLTLTLPMWDDLMVPAQATRINPVQTKPDFAAFPAGSGTLTFLFDPDSDESVHFSAQMPHAWVEGTSLRPHIHWAPTNNNTGDVIWGLECSIGAIGAVMTATTTIYVTDAGDGVTNGHQVAEFPHQAMVGRTVSSMLVCRLFRDADNLDDDYTGDVAFLQFDWHYQREGLGSRNEYSK